MALCRYTGTCTLELVALRGRLGRVRSGFLGRPGGSFLLNGVDWLSFLVSGGGSPPANREAISATLGRDGSITDPCICNNKTK